MTKFKYSLIIFSFLIVYGCDIDKFTGFDHEAEPIPESARFYGSLTNKFTQQPIKDAIIKVGDQATFSDEKGEYEFYYHLKEDDDRNKQTRLIISATNYLPIDTNIVIFPDNEVIKGLAYAAPIIERIVRIDTVCQAEIFDYQGWADIANVYAEFYYVRSGERVIALTIRVPLQRVDVDTPNTAYFQAFVKTSIDNFGSLVNNFEIYARDRIGYADSTSNNINGVDSLIFPLVFE
jgi:hypothetical protein